MKRSNLHLFGILMLALAAGCATSTQPVIAPTSVTYTQAATYTYAYNARDNSDNVDYSTATDTITTTVASTIPSYQGMSNVTVLANLHSNGSRDTTYISQDTASFWHYNYGLEAINNNSTILQNIGNTPIKMGWVLQAKFNAVAGDKWIAESNDTLRINVTGLGSIAATDTIMAVEMNDTTIIVNGTSVPAKHVFLTVTLTALNNPLVTTVDTYVSTSTGVTLNIVHSADISIPGLYTGPVKGNQSLMVRHS